MAYNPLLYDNLLNSEGKKLKKQDHSESWNFEK